MENKHLKNKKTLKILGFILTGIGGICSIVGIGDFFISFGSGTMPSLFFMAFIGFPLLGVGVTLLRFSHTREIASFIKNESVPVINEAAEELSPAIDSVTRTIKNSLSDTEKSIKCSCGALNDSDSTFCKKCGKSLNKTCIYCGARIDSDSMYCGKCGKKTEN